MSRYQGRLELTWTNKDRALLSTGDGKYDYEFVDPHDPRVLEVRLLNEVEQVAAAAGEDRPDDLPQPTTGNLLITGDAMHALDAIVKTPELAAQYLGKIKLVYIDPPFNTGKIFDHYEDNIEHSIWLTLLRDRLRQVKPLLAPDGSVWVHLDDAEVHRCRSVMDEELGAENFVATVIWQKAYSPRNDVKGLSTDHDYILVYSREPEWIANRLERLASRDALYTTPDGDPRPWVSGDPAAPGARSNDETSIFGIQSPFTGEMLYPARGRHWGQGVNNMQRLVEEWGVPYRQEDIGDAERRAGIRDIPPANARPGIKALVVDVPLADAAAIARERYDRGAWPRLYFTRGGVGGLKLKRYLDEIASDRAPQTLWMHDDVGHSRSAKAEIKALFPDLNPFATPKPERLLERIIHIASKPGDLVLDCFAGSGTTAAVAHKMGRRWVTSELLPETVEMFTKPRLTKVVKGDDPGGITTLTERVASDETALPEGVTPDDAQEFTRLLGKFAKDRSDLSTATLKALRAAARTREVLTRTWHGGGGFVHLSIGPSMYEVDEDGDVFLSPAATNGTWSKSVAAQLKFNLTPGHPVFCGVRGRQRLAVIDGVADEVVVRTVLENLADRERAVIVAKAVLPEAQELLSDLSPGSRIRKAPEDLFPKRTVK